MSAEAERSVFAHLLQKWGVFALLGLLLIGIILFLFLVLLPDVRRRADYQDVLLTAQADLLMAQQAQLDAPTRVQNQLQSANARLNSVAERFLNESESTIIVNRLYSYAETANVEIINLQAVPAVVNPTHTQRDYRFQVAGGMVSLLNFLGTIQEVTLPGFIVSNVAIVPAAENADPAPDPPHTHMMNMNVTVISSPHSTSTVLGPNQVPDAMANVGDLPLAEVQRRVEAAWQVRDWEQAINLLDQVVTTSPENTTARLALYRAHVNRGYHYLVARDYAAAAEAFETALSLLPEGQEAISELQQLTFDSTLSHRVEDELRRALAQANANANWQESIRLLRIIAAVDPEYGPVTEELTQAYLNYGNQLAQAGDTTGAEEQFQLAQYHTTGQAPIAAAAVPTTTSPISVSVAPPPQAMPTAANPNAMPASPPTAIPAAPAAQPTPQLTPQPTTVPATTSYVVQPGDTLYTIAQQHGTTVDVLRAANNLSSNNIVVGQVLFIALPQSPAPGYIEHIVTANDTLNALAQRYGTTVEAIMQINGLANATLYVGQRLLIPTPLSVAPSSTPLAAMP